jgi:hypothetical protein
MKWQELRDEDDSEDDYEILSNKSNKVTLCFVEGQVFDGKRAKAANGFH